MIRFFILAGYASLMMSLQISGKLDQYINVHYRYLATFSLVLSLLLAVIQLILWTREGKPEETLHKDEHPHEHPHTSSHDHQHGLTKWYQRLIAYFLLALPLIVGFVFPTVSLDTTIVEAKGFQFPLSKESTGDPDMQTQYLKPDTSIYFTEDDYNEQMEQLMKTYGDQETIPITDENYLEIMELIYNYPSEFIGRKISYTGFAFHSNEDTDKDVFIFRFGIIHCIADAGVFGLLTRLPEGETLSDNDWVEITGTITSDYYHPFKRTLPMVDVVTVKAIDPPDNQYVYRTF